VRLLSGIWLLAACHWIRVAAGSIPDTRFFIYLWFISAFWTPDFVPFRFNRYFFKLSMLFAYKLINGHYFLLTRILFFTEFILHTCLYIRPIWNIALAFWEVPGGGWMTGIGRDMTTNLTINGRY